MCIRDSTITVYTENQIGLLNRIAIIFTRRKINIDSLNTSPSEVDSVHRFTIVINETEDVVRKLCRQIEKQVEVLKAYYNTCLLYTSDAADERSSVDLG